MVIAFFIWLLYESDTRDPNTRKLMTITTNEKDKRQTVILNFLNQYKASIMAAVAVVILGIDFPAIF